MGSWARTGRGCTLHSGGCTAGGLGPARVEVLSGGRKAVGSGRGEVDGRTATPQCLGRTTTYALEPGDQSFQDPLDQLMVKWLLVLTHAVLTQVNTLHPVYI